MEKIGLQAVLEDSNFQAGLKRYESGVSHMTKITDGAAAAISGAFKVGTGLSIAAIGGLVAASKIGFDAILAKGEELDKLNDMFGLGAKQADVFATAFSHFGIPVEEAAQQINFFTRGLAETVKVGKDGKQSLTPFGESLKKLGISAFDAKGKLKTFDQILPQLMDAFKKLPPGVNKTNLAMELFGARGGSKFLDFLSAGSDALKDATKRVDEFGSITDSERDTVEEFGYAMNDLKDGFQRIWLQIGKFVLPIAKKFVDFVNQKILPAISKWTKDNLPKLIAQLQKLGDWIAIHMAPVLNNLFKLFDSGGNKMQDFANLLWSIARAFTASDEAAKPLYSALIGIWDAVSKIADAFKKGGLAGGLQELSTQLQNAFKNIDWAKVLSGLDTLKTNFWNWLTGKGGVLEQVGAQVGKVVTEIQKWLSDPKNTQPIVDAVKSWVSQFWSWLTDPNGGAIATVSIEMAKLTKTIKEWSEAESTKEQFREIGKTIAQTVLDGIGRIFQNPGEGRNLLVDLYNTFRQVYGDVQQFFANIGSSIAGGIIEAIASKFVDGATAQKIANGFANMLNQLYTTLTAPGGPLLNFVWRIFQEMVRQLNALLQNIGQYLNVPIANIPGTGTNNSGTSGNGGSSGFANGGPVMQTGPALVHQGEWVLNRRQVAALAPILAGANNSRTYNFNHTWNGQASAVDKNSIESVVKRATYQAIAETMGAS